MHAILCNIDLMLYSSTEKDVSFWWGFTLLLFRRYTFLLAPRKMIFNYVCYVEIGFFLVLLLSDKKINSI
jgi:hypothetical protein